MKPISILLVLIIHTTSGLGQDFEKEYINPTPGYTNVVAITSHNIRTLYIAGQVGSGATMKEQFVTSFQAVLAQLKASGAEFADIVKMTIYIVDYREEDLALISAARKEVFGEGPMPAITMLGVSSLAFDNMKVETEAVAVMQLD